MKNQIQTNTTPDPLCLIAGRAVANAEAGLRFQKDWGKVQKDAWHDLKALRACLGAGRLYDAIYALLNVTIFVAQDEDRNDWPGALLALSALTQWVREEQRRATNDRS